MRASLSKSFLRASQNAQKNLGAQKSSNLKQSTSKIIEFQGHRLQITFSNDR
jgi:hypothetical protein